MPVNLNRLEKLCKGDQEKKKKYLRQFLEIVPPEIHKIREALKTDDHNGLRQTVHFLAPQLTFFGIPYFGDILTRLEREADELSSENLSAVLERSLEDIALALTQIENYLNETPNDHNP